MATKGLSMNVNIMDMDIAQDFISMMLDAVKDKRIPEELREEYKVRLFKIINENGYYIEDTKVGE